MSSESRIALITGASSGIGRTSSIALARKGWRIVLSGRRKEELELSAKMCEEAAKEAGFKYDLKDDTLVVAGDVSKEENVEELFAAIEKKFGRLDMLFNVSEVLCYWDDCLKRETLVRSDSHLSLLTLRLSFRLVECWYLRQIHPP